jgi:hypothetical protein
MFVAYRGQQRKVGLANAVAHVQPDLNAGFDASSQPPCSGCCDDLLSPLSTPATNFSD